ncbi:MAG: 4Fe-4S double cluster binding domain-containing protein [Candidatus Omnitrophica bacterium]|nr:4Fe-4S double cluster binding domain-containing protein [Candidatus Omnitrophota bacterium]MDD5500325.1 4Fe-4S double cluster binding domain-containing protein [Candidatus Omnitrophota bacterium]
MLGENKNRNYVFLKKACRKEGIEIFGVADIGGIKNEFKISQKTLSGMDRAVCLGLELSSAVLSEIESAPTRLYFYHYRIVNSFLDQVALKLCNIMQRKGFSALAVPSTQIIDWEKNSAHLSHRRLGFLAGLGWIGRNNLLVNEKFGSQFRLVSILTNMPLKTDSPSKKDCGKCRLCVKMCPSGAIRERAEDFDGRKCFEQLRSFQKQRQVEQYVCGICVNACKGRLSEK